MKPSTELSPGALIAIAALGLLGLLGGWLITLSAGFHHAPHRYTRETTFVGGLPAAVMAILFFSMALVGACAIVQSRKLARHWYVVCAAAILLPPLAYTFLAS